MSKEIADALNVEPKEIIRPPKIKSLVPGQDAFTQQLLDNKREDYVAVRDNIRNLIAEVEMVIGDAVVEVRSNPSARMYESFCQLVQVFSNINQQLLKMHTTTAEPNQGEDNQQKSINNVVFVGTSDSLIDQIRNHIPNQSRSLEYDN